MPRISLPMRLGCLLVLGLLLLMFLPSLMRAKVREGTHPEEILLTNVVAAANAWDSSSNGPLSDLTQLDGKHLDRGGAFGSETGSITNHFQVFPPKKLRLPPSNSTWIPAHSLDSGWIRAVSRKSFTDARRSKQPLRSVVFERQDGVFNRDWLDEKVVKDELASANEPLAEGGHVVLVSSRASQIWLPPVALRAILIGFVVVLILPPKSRA